MYAYPLTQELRLIISRQIGDNKWYIDQILWIEKLVQGKELSVPPVLSHMDRDWPQLEHC